jgi:adenylate kinase
MNIVLLGAAGSGKGTQAKLISEKYSLQHISMGDLLREEAKKETELAKKIKEKLNKGELLPTEITIKLIEQKTKENFNNIVFDGFPRSLEQAEALDKEAEINLVLSIEIPDETAIERLSKRRQCKKCGTITTDKEKECPECKGELYRRNDDNPEAIKKRLEIYHDEVEPLKEYYKPRDIVKIIDGTKKIEKIFTEISEIIDAHK